MNLTSMAVSDAKAAFGRIPHGADASQVRGVGRFEFGSSDYTHVQGVVRYRDRYLLTHSDRELPWGRLISIPVSGGDLSIEPLQAKDTEDGYFHPGGCQLISDCLVVPLENHYKTSLVMFYDVSNMTTREIRRIPRCSGTNAAGGTVIRVANRPKVVVCAYGGHPHGWGDVDVYWGDLADPDVLPDLQPWFSARVDEPHHQSFQLFASVEDGGEQLYAVGLNKGNGFDAQDAAVLHKLEHLESRRPSLVVALKRIFSRGPSFNLRWGSSLSVSEDKADFELVFTGDRMKSEGRRTTVTISTRRRALH